MATFNHKGIEIEFDDGLGIFRAKISGKAERAPSLDAMQKKIDKAAEEAFEPFFALRRKSHSDPKNAPTLVKIRIIRKDKGGRGRYERNNWGFADEAGKLYRNETLLPDTQEARQLFAACEAAEEELIKAERARSQAREALPYIKFEF